eukprot:scaffold2003_cov119-Isochrysis_galbana.AAC.5
MPRNGRQLDTVLALAAIPNWPTSYQETIAGSGVTHSPVRIGVRDEYAALGPVEGDAKGGCAVEITQAPIRLLIDLIGWESKT